MGDRFKGSVAIVTGGGNGIGKACGQKLVAEGAKIVVADILPEAGLATVDEFRAQGAEAIFCPLDASKAEQNTAVAEQAMDAYGAIDILVTAAGMVIGSYKSGDMTSDQAYMQEIMDFSKDPTEYFFNMNLGDWQKLIDVNLTGTMLAIQACAPHMKATNGGSIVTISSAEGKRPHGSLIPYAVSKAAVIMLTKCLAINLTPANIRINSVAPGFTETNLTKAVLQTDGIASALAQEIPMARPGQPDEIADAVLFLASQQASFFTGETLHPAGGMYL